MLARLRMAFVDRGSLAALGMQCFPECCPKSATPMGVARLPSRFCGVVRNFAVFLLLDYTGSEPPVHVMPKKSRHLMSLSEADSNCRVWQAIQMHSGCLQVIPAGRLAPLLGDFQPVCPDILDKLMQTMWDKLRYYI
ncbi:hypothetical protein ABBQ38_012257 [Trebouxia sp. C0009 RCD-2024]